MVNDSKNLKDKNIHFIIRGKGKQLSYLQWQKTEFQIDNMIIDSSFLPIVGFSLRIVVSPLKRMLVINKPEHIQTKSNEKKK